MHKEQRCVEIKRRLSEQFHPSLLEIIDDSERHAGHAGAASGAGHFRIQIVSTHFKGMATLARHRAIYSALADMMQTEIHALSIDAGIA